MPTPFPGMDPYLEARGLWEEVHAVLIVEIQQTLGPLVRPRYRVAIERRIYLALLAPAEFAGKPDVLIVSPPGQAARVASAAAPTAVLPQEAELPVPDEVVERYLEVHDVVTGDVITVIEILSPTNKLTREGRDQYERKRLKVLASSTNLIEVDLLRAGQPFPFRVRSDGVSDYRLLVSRAQQRPHADVYLFSVRDPIPDIPVPLRPGEPEPVLPLNQILHTLYDRAGYDLAVHYQQPPEPPLNETDTLWMTQLLQQGQS